MKNLIVWGFTALVALGCAHGVHTRGSIVTKSGDKEAQVCIGSEEVKPGDKVALFDNRCKDVSHNKAEFSDPHCEKVKIGEGEVVRTLNEHYSVIKVASGTPLKVGTVVEKK